MSSLPNSMLLVYWTTFLWIQLKFYMIQQTCANQLSRINGKYLRSQRAENLHTGVFLTATTVYGFYFIRQQSLNKWVTNYCYDTKLYMMGIEPTVKFLCTKLYIYPTIFTHEIYHLFFCDVIHSQSLQLNNLLSWLTGQ